MDLTYGGHSFEALLSLAARQPGMNDGKGGSMQTGLHMVFGNGETSHA
jgi:hypothetical protein